MNYCEIQLQLITQLSVNNSAIIKNVELSYDLKYQHILCLWSYKANHTQRQPLIYHIFVAKKITSKPNRENERGNRNPFPFVVSFWE